MKPERAASQPQGPQPRGLVPGARPRASAAIALSVAACAALAACGAAAPHRRPRPDPHTVALTEIPGNAYTPTIWRVVVRGRRLSVQTQTRGRAEVTPPPGWRTVRRAVLDQRQIRILARDTAALTHVPFAITGACHNLPIGDVGGRLLTIDSRQTDCPPPAAQPLVRWLGAYAPR